MGKKIQLGRLPAPSTATTSEPVFEVNEIAATLRFQFDRDGVVYRSGIRFEHPRSYRFRAESHCTAWHIEGVYDTISEIQQSDWIEELTAATPAESGTPWEMHHFIIYFDSVGCFEVIGSSWSLLPEERVR